MVVQRYYRVEGAPQTVDIRLDLDHSNMMKLIENPIKKNLALYDDIDSAKSSVPLFYYGELKDRSTIYLKDNYGIRTALVLDYDKNITIGEWYEANKNKFRFYLHTSFKHSEENHRFRVIIPTMQNFYMTAELKKCLFEDFPNVDSSTFDNRGFYIPACYTNNYAYLYNEGAILNLGREYADRIQRIVNSYPVIDDIKQTDAIITDDDRLVYANRILDKARDKMDSVSWTSDGGRFTTLRATWYYLWKHRDIVDKHEAEVLFDEYNLQSKQLKDLKGYMRSW